MNYGSAKAKIVQILFSQIHKNYAKYTFETFTVDGIPITYEYSIEGCLSCAQVFFENEKVGGGEVLL
jgi:hypothetical protein